MPKYSLIALLVSGLIGSQLITFSEKTIASTEEAHILVAQNTNLLTEEKVLAIMEQIKQAEQNEDIDTIVSFLAPFVISAITVENKDTVTTRNLQGKQAHRDFLENSFKVVKQREEINSYLTVSTSEDEQLITVTRLHIREVETENTQKFISSSTDVIYFALVEGKPMIIGINTKGWLEERP